MPKSYSVRFRSTAPSSSILRFISLHKWSPSLVRSDVHPWLSAQWRSSAPPPRRSSAAIYSRGNLHGTKVVATVQQSHLWRQAALRPPCHSSAAMSLNGRPCGALISFAVPQPCPHPLPAARTWRHSLAAARKRRQSPPPHPRRFPTFIHDDVSLRPSVRCWSPRMSRGRVCGGGPLLPLHFALRVRGNTPARPSRHGLDSHGLCSDPRRGGGPPLPLPSTPLVRGDILARPSARGATRRERPECRPQRQAALPSLRMLLTVILPTSIYGAIDYRPIGLFFRRDCN